MAQKLVDHSLYHDLIGSIKSTISRGLITAQKVIEYERLRTYWCIGKHIHCAVKRSKGKLRLGGMLYRRIQQDLDDDLDLDLSLDLLRRTVSFYKAFPVFPKQSTLTFSHYVLLQRLSKESDRRKVESLAMHEQWSVCQLKDEIRYFTNRVNLSLGELRDPLVCVRGEPYIYRVKLETDIDGNDVSRIDCGFRIFTTAPSLTFALDQTRIVRSNKVNDRYVLQKHQDGLTLLYTYVAVVERIIDGDTLDVVIDVGFGITLRDRLRLKGINAPEMGTPSGQLAKTFVQNTLASCPLIVMRSSKSEMYGRWLADIFYLPQCQDPFKIAREGQYLNQVLIDQGLAERYS